MHKESSDTAIGYEQQIAIVLDKKGEKLRHVSGSCFISGELQVSAMKIESRY